MEVLLSSPRGFCAGVVRAIEVVEICLRRFGAPVYVKHQIVHNPHVVADLERKGAKTVETIEEIPPGSLVVFSGPRLSARGLYQSQREEPAGHRRRVSAGYSGTQRGPRSTMGKVRRCSW